MGIQAGVQVQVTVFGNRLRESCSPRFWAEKVTGF